VRDPAGSIADLPPPDVVRWTIRRKAAILTAVAQGLLTGDEACRRYRISAEEFRYWQQAFQAHGLPGLRVTRLKELRKPESRRNG
jgi:hypothetical protein